jgi:molybdate transport system ATP-binding protein
MSLLEVRCRLRYSSGFEVDVDFASTAQVTALFGPSGSGKTTILSAIAGLRRPDSGVIQLGDRRLFDSAAKIDLPPNARRIGYVFQGHLLFPHLTVRQNLLYGWTRRQESSGTVEFERLVESLEIRELLDRMPHTLSGGERQRVALGRALMSAPQLLLLDEPLASVDAALKDRLMDFTRRVLNEWRIPTLYVSHDPEEVRQMAQCVVHLDAGRIKAIDRQPSG